jgi:hypothetical protein
MRWNEVKGGKPRKDRLTKQCSNAVVERNIGSSLSPRAQEGTSEVQSRRQNESNSMKESLRLRDYKRK